jgi:hypothetical protein
MALGLDNRKTHLSCCSARPDPADWHFRGFTLVDHGSALSWGGLNLRDRCRLGDHRVVTGGWVTSRRSTEAVTASET